MKRVLLLIVFFVGLVPNMKDMCVESLYNVKGQTLYGEQYGEPFPHCQICLGELVETGYGNEAVEYCPNCQFYCSTCKDAFYKTEDGDDEAIHYSSHESENENDGDEGDNNDDNNDNNDEDESVENKYYICLSCLNPLVLTLEERNIHIRQYGHKYFKEVQP